MSTAPCKDCLSAAVRRHHGFAMGCRGCCARAAARSHHFHRVKQAGRLDSEYRRLLDHFKLTHDEVKAAQAADAMSKESV